MIENCYLILGFNGPYLLFPVIRLSKKPLWYSLCSIKLSPATVDQIYNATLFTLDGKPRDSDYFQVSVSGKLRIDKEFFLEKFSLAIGHPSEFFCFHLKEVTLPQPVQLPYQARLFLALGMLFPVIIEILGSLALLFFGWLVIATFLQRK